MFGVNIIFIYLFICIKYLIDSKEFIADTFCCFELSIHKRILKKKFLQKY